MIYAKTKLRKYIQRISTRRKDVYNERTHAAARYTLFSLFALK